jgi:hypothetical protein
MPRPKFEYFAQRTPSTQSFRRVRFAHRSVSEDLSQSHQGAKVGKEEVDFDG